MTAYRQLSRALVLLPLTAVASALPACGDDTFNVPSQVLWSSEHFDYRVRPGDRQPCAALADVFERQFAAVTSYLGVSWPAGRKIGYYKFTDEADSLMNSGCRVRGACAANSDVYSYETFHEHELIHAYLSPFGEPPSLFQEGIAVTLACDQAEVGAASPQPTWRDAVILNDPTTGTNVVYRAGSVLVDHLLTTYGPAPFMRLYGALAHNASPEVVDARMQEIYGATADDIWAAAAARPRGCVPVSRCSRPEIATDGAPVATDEQCGLDVDRRTISIAEATNVVISTTIPTSFKLDACDHSLPSAYLPDATDACSPNGLLGALEPGRYYVEFATGASELAVTLPAVPALGSGCDVTAPLLVPNGTHAFSIRPFTGVPQVAKDMVVKLRFDGTASVFLFSNTLGNVDACPSCDWTSADCMQGTPGKAAHLAPAGESDLHFNYTPSTFGNGPDHANLSIGICPTAPAN